MCVVILLLKKYINVYDSFIAKTNINPLIRVSRNEIVSILKKSVYSSLFLGFKGISLMPIYQ